MIDLLSGPAAPVIGFFIAVGTAYKAADLLDVENPVLAIVFAAALAFFGPLLIGDMLATVSATTSATAVSPNDGVAALSGFVPERMIGIIARMGFAFTGVLLWLGIERAV